MCLDKEKFQSLVKKYGVEMSADLSAWKNAMRKQKLTLLKAYLCKTISTLIRRNNRNTQSLILKAYDSQWKKKPFARYHPRAVLNGAAWVWGNLKWEMSNEAGAAARLIFLDEVISRLRPSSVLEVGAGNGINLLILSARYPGISFYGLEPTNGGIEAAKLVIEEGRLPEALVQFSPFPLEDIEAPARIQLKQGSAQNMPFTDDSFDLVFTSLALEQMEAIRTDALREISRVARNWVVMLEPFKDVNSSGWRRLYVRTHDYFQGSIEELGNFGLQVEEVNLDMPHKAMLGTALVVARRM